MDKAKDSIKNFMSKSGHHDTTVHEKIAPAVQHETVEQRQHEEMVTATDREVHQDHYHTSEQPIVDKEVLPEQHHHNFVPVEHRKFEHGNQDEVERRLQEERAGYQDQSTRVEGEHTRSVAPTVEGEHVHHHVYENIQPVVNKQTIEPHVVHTTVPIHEVHHNQAQHHSASALPAVSMEDFKKQGGSLGGREERHDHFSGEPKWSQAHTGEQGFESHSGRGYESGIGQRGDNTTGASGLGQGAQGGYGNESSGLGSDARGDYRAGESGLGSGIDRDGQSGLGSSARDQYNDGRSGASQSTGKPSLMDKLNPKVDANGDGKAGFMK